MSKISASLKQEEELEGEQQLFAKLLAESEIKSVLQEGEVIEGEIVAITKGEVLVNFGGKAEGVIQGKDLAFCKDEESDIQMGASVLAVVLVPEDDEGRAVLSFRKARAERKWREMEKKFKEKAPVSVTVVQPNKGGLIVNAEGLQGFVPISQLGPDHYPSTIQKGPGFADAAIAYLTQFVGSSFEALIIEYERENNRLILSERLLLQQIKGVKPLEEFEFKVGDAVTGKVVAIKDFGVFVDLGITSGLVHISEMSWDRVNHPGDLVRIGDDLEVKVIGIEEGGRRVSLSMKQLLNNPWARVANKYSLGQTVQGTVTKIVDYGAFVQIEPGFDGLVHISELSSLHVKDPADILKEGKECDFKIILLDVDQQRLGLSYKQANIEQGIFDDNQEPLPEPPPGAETKSPASLEDSNQVVVSEEELKESNAPEVESVDTDVDSQEQAATAPDAIEETAEIDPEQVIQDLTAIEGVGPKVAEKLIDNGYRSIAQVAEASIAALSLIPGLRRASADKIKTAAENHLSSQG
ncbi:MAG TPA: S1 RNA-binding domain-containing protein [Candidatus Wirthbacteria bacterium]|nr:S1 RNA-binding domain-containing protein [Candidatus Wirthbacteria bacterium]